MTRERGGGDRSYSFRTEMRSKGQKTRVKESELWGNGLTCGFGSRGSS